MHLTDLVIIVFSPSTLNDNIVYYCKLIIDQAVSEGATVLYPVRDQFYRDRSGYLRDPFGHLWSLATHKKDLSLDEIKKAGEAYFEEMSKTKTGMR
jgi:hypothetical protein